MTLSGKLFSILLLCGQFISPAFASDEQRFADFGTCYLNSGASLKDCRIGYRTYGKLNKAKNNAILIPTWYGGSSQEHAYLADSQYISPENFFVIIVDAIGNGVSVSPSNSPSQPLGQLPIFTIADMVSVQHRLITEKLGITSLHAIVGLSMGAMQSLQWAVQYPGFATRYASIIGSPKLAAFDIINWSTRIKLMAWHLECQCQTPLEVMAAMRMLGQTPASLTETFDGLDVEAEIAKRAKSAQLPTGQTWNKIRQAQAMLAYNITEQFDNDLAKAANAINEKLLIIVSKGDRVVSPGPATALARLTDATLLELDKGCGHADPWCDAETFSNALREFLAE